MAPSPNPPVPDPRPQDPHHGLGLVGGPRSPCGKAVQTLWQVASWRRETSGRRQGPVSLLQGALKLARGLLVLDGPGEAMGTLGAGMKRLFHRLLGQ